jgi:spermidine/putrescine transport system ATP-binding protein
VADIDIALNHLTKQFGSVVAVNDASIEVRKGEFLSVIGPSGCGKTTTMRMIAGLEMPTSGEILLQGVNVVKVPTHKRNIGMVFQSFALFPHMTVRGNVEFGMKMKGVSRADRKEKALKALRIMGLESMAERDVTELSGGQRQRVGLARALAVEPAVVLLDEPLGSLDPSLRIGIQSELKRVQREMGITFIHVSHNQSEALAMADRMVVMAQGRFEQVAPPGEVYAAPATRFVAAFVGRNNIFQGTIESTEGDLLRVRTRQGVFTIKTSATSKPLNKDIWFVVRAELLQVPAESGSPLENQVSGKIVGLEYTGSVVMITVALPDGREVKMEQHESLARKSVPSLAETITLGWRPEDPFILPD